MKTALLTAFAALSATAMAVEDQPVPGLSLDPVPFNDWRLALGVAAPITKAEAVGVNYDADQQPRPHIGLQWVHGLAGTSYGAALGFELAYDDHSGEVSGATGVQTLYGTGATNLRAATIGLLPKLVLRPDYNDPFDWAPGSVQIELGPVLAAGVGWAHIGGSQRSEATTVLRWGFRLDLVWTLHTRWQAGLSLGWESVAASPSIEGDSDASISGDGVCGGLIFGRRM
jgi:hypothetical protein